MPDGKWVSKANLQTFWQMIRSKSLPTMIGDTVTTWLNDHVTPTGSAVVVDNTLTIEGAAADAKKTGDEISGLKEDIMQLDSDLDAEVTRAEAEEARIEALFTQPVEEAINDWLDAHPEATTTVQDGSLTESKFADSLNLKAIKDYVTPQMFGAVADGATDDTDAIQDAFASLENGSTLVFPKGNYLISDMLAIHNKARINIVSEGAVITYTGNDYAIDLQDIQYSNFRFGSIRASNGGCLRCYASNDNNSMYINISFEYFYASTNCVYFDTSGSGYFNEVRFFNGRVYGYNSNVIGFYCHNEKTDSQISHLIFENIGFEGSSGNTSAPLAVGVKLETPSTIYSQYPNAGFKGLYFASCRMVESFTKLFVTTGPVTEVLILEPDFYVGGGSRLEFDKYANNWTIVKGRTIDYVRDGMYFYNGAYVLDGTEDLNNILTVGDYVANANSVANSITNTPVKTAFRLKVYYPTNGAGITCQHIENIYGEAYHRYYTSSSSTFSTWWSVQIRNPIETIIRTYQGLGTKITANSEQDLNNYTAINTTYYCSDSSVAQGLSHCPVTTAFKLIVEKMNNDTSYIQTITPSASTADARFYRRVCRSGTWGSWYCFEGTVVS